MTRKWKRLSKPYRVWCGSVQDYLRAMDGQTAKFKTKEGAKKAIKRLNLRNAWVMSLEE